MSEIPPRSPLPKKSILKRDALNREETDSLLFSGGIGGIGGGGGGEDTQSTTPLIGCDSSSNSTPERRLPPPTTQTQRLQRSKAPPPLPSRALPPNNCNYPGGSDDSPEQTETESEDNPSSSTSPRGGSGGGVGVGMGMDGDGDSHNSGGGGDHTLLPPCDNDNKLDVASKDKDGNTIEYVISKMGCPLDEPIAFIDDP